ncbi:response regulator transcription factor, partial [Nitrosospira sp. Nsp13]|uniref:LuxR C-terminal-related transcriptional regulator n=1 Tax=Nitrosospira sp. Nsp13 TaxID=1855332 RepID=UPI00087F37C1
GAEGYLTKQSSPDQLIQAVRQVKQGRLYVDPVLAAEMVDGIVHNNASEDPLIVLSPREFQLFKLMAEGHSIAQIADIISISPKTVRVHHTSIMRKLNLENTTQLVRLAIHCNIIAS